jgi:NADH-quinone oxidoreductase subunit A
MPAALSGSMGIVGYLALFAGAGFFFVFLNLLIGWFLRPKNPHVEKGEIYECGEPAIGSSFVQFDLRFYVVALIFIIFDVEVAFLFPWATVFGKAANLQHTAAMAAADSQLSESARAIYTELGVPAASTAVAGMTSAEVAAGAQQLLALATVEVLVFFLILLIAFAYEWRLGALDWVRALMDEHSQRSKTEFAPRLKPDTEAVLSA